MLTAISATCLLYLSCALLYQADGRRAGYASIKASQNLRYGMRLTSIGIALVALLMLTSLQDLERSIPIWLAAVSAVFVIGLFIAAQRPDWHAYSGLIAGAIGLLTLVAGVLI